MHPITTYYTWIEESFRAIHAIVARQKFDHDSEAPLLEQEPELLALAAAAVDPDVHYAAALQSAGTRTEKIIEELRGDYIAFRESSWLLDPRSSTWIIAKNATWQSLLDLRPFAMPKESAGAEECEITRIELSDVAKAVRLEGKHASMERILGKVDLKKQKVNFALRVLEKQGKYAGFSKKPTDDMAARVDRFLKGSVPESSGN